MLFDLPEMDYEKWLTETQTSMGAYGERFAKVYGADAKVSTKTARQQMWGDYIFTWEMRTWARLADATGNRAYRSLSVQPHSAPTR